MLRNEVIETKSIAMNKFYLSLLILLTLNSLSQNEFKIWYFGNQAGLDFTTNPPTVLTNTFVNCTEGVATVCDNSGSFLFYSDGTALMDATNTYMANGMGLGGGQSSTQSAIIVKQPGVNTNYYVFTVPIGGTNNVASYSIVDMSLAAGLGSVTVKNAFMYNGTTEKQVAIRHCNGKDVWIISHKNSSNEFKAYLLSSSGLSSMPVTTSIGNPIYLGPGVAGHIKVSPDGKKLAMATASANISTATISIPGFYLFDFDASSGIITNSLSLLTNTVFPLGCGPYGMEFSPDGTKLFGTTSTGTTYSCALYQWNICAPTPSAIIASQYSLSIPNINLGSIQKAIDNKMYIAMGSTPFLSVISNPNGSGAAMGFSLNAIALAPNTMCALGLPNYINGYTHAVPSLFTNTLNCQNASFSIPPVPTFSAGCSATPYTPGSYLWDFGEPASGAANTSTLANPSHYYGSTGTYTATLIIYSNCINDTLKKTITVSTPGPIVSVTGNSVICKGDRYTYTASGASTYSWTTGSSASSTTFAPNTTTVLSVTGSSAGCSTTKSFSVTVNPCTGISSVSDNETFNIFPNPFKDQLFIEASGPAEIVISNLNGAVVLKSKLNQGKNEITTSQLNSGIYLIQAKSVDQIWRGRFIKVE